MLKVGGSSEKIILLTGGGCPGRVGLFREYTFIPRKHIPVRKYEGGYIAGPIKDLRRRNFGKR